MLQIDFLYHTLDCLELRHTVININEGKFSNISFVLSSMYFKCLIEMSKNVIIHTVL